MTPQAAAEKAFKRVEEIFAKYPITQALSAGQPTGSKPFDRASGTC